MPHWLFDDQIIYLVICRIKLTGTLRISKFRTCPGVKQISQAVCCARGIIIMLIFCGNNIFYGY